MSRSASVTPWWPWSSRPRSSIFIRQPPARRAAPPPGGGGGGAGGGGARSSPANRLRDAQRLHMLAHVVGAEDRRAAVERRHRGSDRRRRRAGRRRGVAEQPAEGALAGEADE